MPDPACPWVDPHSPQQENPEDEIEAQPRKSCQETKESAKQLQGRNGIGSRLQAERRMQGPKEGLYVASAVRGLPLSSGAQNWGDQAERR